MARRTISLLNADKKVFGYVFIDQIEGWTAHDGKTCIWITSCARYYTVSETIEEFRARLVRAGAILDDDIDTVYRGKMPATKIE